MPLRNDPLVNDYYYHIINRGVEKRNTFMDNNDYGRFLLGLSYYRHVKLPTRLSVYIQAKKEVRDVYNNKISTSNEKLVTIFAYCLMQNHIHLLLKQNVENGISKYMLKVSDSYTKYFNKRYRRVGSLFQGTFKSVLIENDEEFLHVSRYIHLNPFTANSSMSIESCLTYPWSSTKNYFSNAKSFIDTSPILSYFKTDREKYKQYLSEQSGYQRSLAALRAEHGED